MWGNFVVESMILIVFGVILRVKVVKFRTVTFHFYFMTKIDLPLLLETSLQ